MIVERWGRVDCGEAVARQRQLMARILAGGRDTLVLCEHPPTVTLGRKSRPENIFLSPAELVRQGVALLPVDRGGDVTLHAPGQLVVYPLVDLRRRGLGLKEYLRLMELTAVDFLSGFGIVANGDEQHRGVWVGPRKIASIGIGVSHWVAYHGMAINVSNDLALFGIMRPCGLDVKMTSVKAEAGGATAMDDAMARFEQAWRLRFEQAEDTPAGVPAGSPRRDS